MTLKCLLLISVMGQAVLLPAQTTQRNALIEDFSNAECSPCKTLSEQFHPAAVTIGTNDTAAHLNTIAYQLNYPGFDPSYNAHAQQRSDYYVIGGLPAIKVNGRPVNPMFDQAQFEDVFDTSRNRPSSFNMSGTYIMDEAAGAMHINFSVLPLRSMQGPYKVHAAIVERSYHNPQSTIGMYDFYFVMRRMFPDGNGKAEHSWTANTARSFRYDASFNVNNPPPVGSFDFWDNPMLSDLVIFVQDTVTRDILQSQVIKPSTLTAIKEQRRLRQVLLYPNPARDVVRVAFDMEERTDAVLLLTDPGGRIIRQMAYPGLAPGRHALSMVTHDLAAGTYWLQLTAGGERLTRILNIAH